MWWIRSGLIAASASLVLLAAAPFGVLAGVWRGLPALLLVALSVLFALLAVLVSVVGWIKTSQWQLALVALALAHVPLLMTTRAILAARGAPAIHDITTDVNDPPQFVAVVPLRASAPNPPQYDGAAAAEQQRRAFPDIQPLMLPRPPGDVYRQALDLAGSRGWEIVGTDETAGRIEATATTYWLGFEDDVVIVVRSANAGSRVDMRSKSRVGVGDLGTNARRIREFLDALRGSR